MRLICFALMLAFCISASAHRHPGPVSDVAAHTCDTCHAAQLKFGHPVNFTPRRALPAAFPLGAQGRFVCETCHRESSSKGHRARPTAKCPDCHRPDFFTVMADHGHSLSDSAHPRLPGINGGGGPDGVSLRCMSCHGNHASSPVTRLAFAQVGMRRGRSMQGLSGSHVIGAVYREYEAFGGYVPRSDVPAQVVLPGGRLSCVSCHESYSARHGAVVSLLGGQSLCAACHDL